MAFCNSPLCNKKISRCQQDQYSTASWPHAWFCHGHRRPPREKSFVVALSVEVMPWHLSASFCHGTSFLTRGCPSSAELFDKPHGRHESESRKKKLHEMFWYPWWHAHIILELRKTPRTHSGQVFRQRFSAVAKNSILNTRVVFWATNRRFTIQKRPHQQGARVCLKSHTHTSILSNFAQYFMSDMYFRFSGDSKLRHVLPDRAQVVGRFCPNLYKKAQIVEILFTGIFLI